MERLRETDAPEEDRMSATSDIVCMVARGARDRHRPAGVARRQPGSSRTSAVAPAARRSRRRAGGRRRWEASRSDVAPVARRPSGSSSATAGLRAGMSSSRRPARRECHGQPRVGHAGADGAASRHGVVVAGGDRADGRGERGADLGARLPRPLSPLDGQGGVRGGIRVTRSRWTTARTTSTTGMTTSPATIRAPGRAASSGDGGVQRPRGGVAACGRREHALLPGGGRADTRSPACPHRRRRGAAAHRAAPARLRSSACPTVRGRRTQPAMVLEGEAGGAAIGAFVVENGLDRTVSARSSPRRSSLPRATRRGRRSRSIPRSSCSSRASRCSCASPPRSTRASSPGSATAAS